MEALVAHKALRLLISKVNAERLGKFDALAIAQCQRHCAPLLTTVLRTCTGIERVDDKQALDSNDEEEDGIKLGDALPQEIPEDQEVTHGRDRILIATVLLCMLCYARNQQSNILQVTAGYFAYTENKTKRMVENLHRMGFLVTYETVRQALQANALAISKELKKKAWERRFFLSFDNMNFYEYRQDQRLHNKGYQVAYTAGYVCFMRSKGDHEIDGNWQQTYLDASQIDYSAVNKLVADDFLLGENDLEHRSHSVRYILSNILGNYFAQALNKQKIRHRDGRCLPKYMKWQAPLREVQCQIEKADIIPLPTLPLDESSIAGTIEILKEYLKRLGIEDVAIINKLLIFKGDFLTVRNVTRAIFRRQEELRSIDRFQFIEPIAGLFYLQMNGKKGDRISLARFQQALSRKGATRDAKNFHASDNFFQTVVTGFALALCMQETLCSEIPKFKIWLSENDWPKMVQDVKNKFLGPFKTVELQASAIEKVRGGIIADIAREKQEWLDKRAAD
ncbi:hypothetical protein MMC31_004799 [Peltigera leucophlebia]|nr:hypothetical protein [Peltigera leucophlebia]